MISKKAYILTFGCQMNKHDSELMGGILVSDGYTLLDSPEQADVILVNTCSVREGAEQRVLARFGNLKKYRKKRSEVVLGICGCMAQRYGDDILDMKIGINLVVGPDSYNNLPTLIQTARQGSATALALSRTETYDTITPARANGQNAWISIMRGCNNFCSYCIVPYLRGRERSMPVHAVLTQLQELPANVREITLLGQNVNSYNDNGTTFASLLEQVNNVAQDRWIRFTSSHPKDFSEDVINAMATLPHICESVHLALQSGSDTILKAMERGYTAAEYVHIVDMIRTAMPHTTIFTDIIVGFPGETEADFQQTLDAIRLIKFDSAFMFKYSSRPGTKAATMDDTVPEAVKSARLTELVALQHEISYKKSTAEIGTIHKVLVEGPSKKREDEWIGRSRTNRKVIFPAAGRTPGETIEVKITGAGLLSLSGTIA